jgi:hypothetical protein
LSVGVGVLGAEISGNVEEIRLCGGAPVPEAATGLERNYKLLIKKEITRKHRSKRNLNWKIDCTCYLSAQFIAGDSLRVGDDLRRYESLP